jgi:chromosome segregation ATPase
MFRASKEIARLKEELENQGAALDRLMERTQRLLETKADLTAELTTLRAENHELDKKNAILMERLDLVVNHGVGMGARLAPPAVMPEEAEDALYAFRSGQIDKSVLERELHQAGFPSAEIEFELSDYPHHAQ